MYNIPWDWNTQTSAMVRVVQENSALRAKVEALENELFRCRTGMAYCYGNAIGIRAVLREVQQAVERRVSDLQLKTFAEGSLDDSWKEKAKWWDHKLRLLSQLSMGLMTASSPKPPLGGMREVVDSYFRLLPTGESG